MRIRSRAAGRALVVLFFGVFAACGVEKEPISIQSPRPLFRVSHLRNPSLEPAFGRWESECRGLSSGESVRSRLDLSDRQMLYTRFEFEDGACADPNRVTLAAYELSQASPHQLEAEGIGFDLATRLQAITLETRGGYAQLANLSRLCGLEDWADAKPRSISGVDCGEGQTHSEGAELTHYLSLKKDTLIFLAESYHRAPTVAHVR
jgi:hypothetical protein